MRCSTGERRASPRMTFSLCERRPSANSSSREDLRQRGCERALAESGHTYRLADLLQRSAIADGPPFADLQRLLHSGS